jgi:hypothetical protein
LDRRVLIAIVILVVLIGAVLGIDALRRRNVAPVAAGEPTVVPGSIPIYVEGRLVGSFGPEDLEQLEPVSFVDAEEGKTQEGWLLRDVLLARVDGGALEVDTLVVVSSSSRDKAVQLTWVEVDDLANHVLFDLSSRGTLKLASTLERLDTRDEWIQDVDKIEVSQP